MEFPGFDLILRISPPSSVGSTTSFPNVRCDNFVLNCFSLRGEASDNFEGLIILFA